MEPRHLESVLAILQKIRYINIATVCADGSSWNTPVSASYDAELNFYWGSSPDNVHSQNIRNDGRVFVTIYDSTVPEGTGEALYMRGRAEELEEIEGEVKKYRFIPAHAWINDEAKDEAGKYSHDLRIELDLNSLRDSML